MNVLTLGRILAGACALVLIFGCASRPPRTLNFASNPMTWDVKEGAAPKLRGQQRIALRNAYPNATRLVVLTYNNVNYDVNLKEFTDTAISMLERHMEKDGITIDANAAKTVTLRVRAMSAAPTVWSVAATSATLDAEFGDGTKTSYRRESKSAGGWSRSLDGAVVLALTAVLNDRAFQAYVNQPNQ